MRSAPEVTAAAKKLATQNFQWPATAIAGSARCATIMEFPAAIRSSVGKSFPRISLAVVAAIRQCLSRARTPAARPSPETLGLLTLMVQSGLPAPCDESSRFVVYPRLYADIGDEQSMEQSLSTFSSHMRNVKDILAKAAPGTLVLLDDSGAGAGPGRGLRARSRGPRNLARAWVHDRRHHAPRRIEGIRT